MLLWCWSSAACLSRWSMCLTGLQRLFSEGRIRKYYLVQVSGTPRQLAQLVQTARTAHREAEAGTDEEVKREVKEKDEAGVEMNVVSEEKRSGKKVLHARPLQTLPWVVNREISMI